MSTIEDRYDGIKFMLGNRSDLEAQIARWTANAYIELASNIPFPNLERGPDDILTASGQDSYQYPSNAMGIIACSMLFNGAKRAVRKKNIEYIDLYPTTQQGPPVIWAPFNMQQVFRPIPGGSYTITRRYWEKPVVNFSTTDTINATTLLVPDNWLEVIDYSAALRGNIELDEKDKAQALNILLHGDPKHPEQPGIIKQRLTRIQAENMNSDYGMRMRVRPYQTR